MPYSKNTQLPPVVRKHLPARAQTIFRETFNQAFKRYFKEETSFRVAWAAVKKLYQKNTKGMWLKK
jgi:cation transport regulator